MKLIAYPLPIHRRTPIRSFLIGRVAGAMNWLDDHICYADSTREIGPVDHLRWFLDGLLSKAFACLYDGSRAEIDDGLDHAFDDLQQKYLTASQRAIRANPSEWFDLVPAPDDEEDAA